MEWNRRAGPQAGLALALLAPLVSGQSAPSAQSDGLKLKVGATEGSRIQYLAARYDKNGDGRITAGEYDRGEERFARLDTNQDGAISNEDFESAGRGMRMDPSRLAAMMISRSFPTGEEDGMSLDRFSQELSEADTDKDGLLTRVEYEEHSAGQDHGGRDAFGMLLDVIDEDADEQLSMDEFVAWFDGRDLDEDMFLDDEELPGGHRSDAGRGSRPEPAADPDLPNAVGKTAPDFELRPPEGGDAVRLSSFAGDRPVALIFGSYT